MAGDSERDLVARFRIRLGRRIGLAMKTGPAEPTRSKTVLRMIYRKFGCSAAHSGGCTLGFMATDTLMSPV
jgi:hypothetical protein